VVAVLQLAPESLYWYWIAERHAIYLRRQQGLPKPWTTDPILRDYKFTNPFRENDRGTVWLRENFLTPHRDDNPGLVAFNICWYRMFNWWGTGEALGWQTDWDVNNVTTALEAQLDRGQQVFTGAHIVYSPPGLGKVEAITSVCAELFALREQIVQTSRNRSLEQVYNLLRTVYCVGGFMAYEMVSDMRHTRLLEYASDIYTWANPGPGAKRGLQRLGMPYTRDKDAIVSMRELLYNVQHEMPDTEVLLKTVGLKDWPVIEMRDIEHSLCEFDKYCRVKFGEGEPRSKFNGR
jgi:hypothetical protein